MKTTKRFEPTWWSDQHASTWERVKAAMRRDFEQTKNDFSGGPDLDQDVDDTLKQAAGRAPIPARGSLTSPSSGEREKRQKKQQEHSGDRQILSEHLDDTDPMVMRSRTAKPAFDDVEAPISFGYAARSQYQSRYPDWTPELETTLRDEWTAGDKDQPWDDVSDYVRRGFEAPHVSRPG